MTLDLFDCFTCRRYIIKRIFVYIIILLLVTATTDAGRSAARTVELTLYPAKAPESLQKYQLLPKAEEQTNADAVPLYEKAVKSLLKDSQIDQKIRQWVWTPIDKLPRKQVQSTLQQLKPTLQLVEQAAKCRQCNWPVAEAGQVTDELMKNLPKYRQVAYILALQARFQIAGGQYDKAIDAIQTGLAMAKHLGEAPTLIQGLVGTAIGGVIYRQLEQLIQAADAPNLYWALQSLPKPFVDPTKQMEPVDDKVRLIMNRFDRHTAALQCIEAIRLHAAAHDSKFPYELSNVTEVPVPDDPVSRKPFVYQRTGAKAVLEAPAPEGATAKEAIRYELTLKE